MKKLEVMENQSKHAELNKSVTKKDKQWSEEPETLDPKPKSKEKNKEVCITELTKGTREVEHLDEANLPNLTFKLSINVQFIIRDYCGGLMREGTKSYLNNSFPRSFIDAKPSQISNISDLINISLNTRLIVSVENFIEGPDLLATLVTEPVLPVITCFKAQADSFKEKENKFDGDVRSKWWILISNDFKQIFRDVVHGLIYLNSLEHRCGDLRNQMYITINGEGKILPSMDKGKSEHSDVVSLIKTMQEIITLPFQETMADKSYELSFDLTYMLDFVTPDKLPHIPFFWLINQPYLWSSDENIIFLKEFQILLKMQVLEQMLINQYLECGRSFGNLYWDTMIDDKVCGGVFMKVYDRPTQVPGVAMYQPSRPVEIVRYMSICYNHLNDDYYYPTKGAHVCLVFMLLPMK